MEPSSENQQKRTVSFMSSEVDPKSHHKSAEDASIPFQFRGQHYNIFEVFNQCKEFGFSWENLFFFFSSFLGVFKFWPKQIEAYDYYIDVL